MARKSQTLPPRFSDRTRFTSQLLSKSAVKATGNTTYEEIGCVGFQPDHNRLEAVIYVKQPTGYSGDICSSGSTEYVRFFLSFDGGGSWEDQGVTSFTVYDISQASKNRLEYATTLNISPKKRFCIVHNFVLARAILSWNLEPPAGDAGFVPPWGNVHDNHIQIDPLKIFPIATLFEEAKFELPENLKQVIDLSQSIPILKKKALTVAELKALYAKEKVEPHRFGFATAQKLINDPEFAASLAAGVKGPIKPWVIDWSKIIDAISKLDGNTSYEELECVGLNTETSELVATFRVKRPSGYSGGPCTDGSTEYVTFWGDFDLNGTFEQCLGTAAVEVYDYDDIPDEGLEYAVFLPVDLNPYRQPCQDGPKLARIRAILSWNTPHPCTKPNGAPYWGNTEDTVVQIPAGPKLDTEDYFNPILYSLCSRHVCTIDQGSGLSTGDRPFGGVVWVKGEFPIGPAVATADRFKYRVRVRPLDPVGAWQILDNKFTIWINESSGGGLSTADTLTQEVDPDGFYTYREFGTPLSGSWRRVTSPNRALARWVTGKDDTGRWEVELIGKDTWTNTVYMALAQVCPDASTRQNVIVKLDQDRPEVVDFRITHFRANASAPWQAAQDCDKFNVGQIIKGTYEVSDEHFRVMTLKVLPKDHANGATVDPPSKTYYAPDFEPTTGTSGEWILDTTGMDPCGYVVLLEVWDRTIASCDADGWYNRDSVGFCLEE
jgi:hypothetical protein